MKTPQYTWLQNRTGITDKEMAAMHSVMDIRHPSEGGIKVEDIAIMTLCVILNHIEIEKDKTKYRAKIQMLFHIGLCILLGAILTIVSIGILIFGNS